MDLGGAAVRAERDDTSGRRFKPRTGGAPRGVHPATPDAIRAPWRGEPRPTGGGYVAVGWTGAGCAWDGGLVAALRVLRLLEHFTFRL